MIIDQYIEIEINIWGRSAVHSSSGSSEPRECKRRFRSEPRQISACREARGTSDGQCKLIFVPRCHQRVHERWVK